jgi:hypothetical protein
VNLEKKGVQIETNVNIIVSLEKLLEAPHALWIQQKIVLIGALQQKR